MTFAQKAMRISKIAFNPLIFLFCFYLVEGINDRLYWSVLFSRNINSQLNSKIFSIVWEISECQYCVLIKCKLSYVWYIYKYRYVHW